MTPDFINWKEYTFEELQDNSHKYPIGDGDHGQITPKYYQKIGIPYVRVKDIVNDELSKKNLVYISEETHKKNSKSHLMPNDVIIAKTGATIGKVAIIPEWMKQANTTSSIGKITVDQSKIIPSFLYYFLKTSFFKREMYKLSNRSAQEGFNVADIKKFKIRVPHIEVQKKIVDILEISDQLRVINEKKLQLYHLLIKSTFLDLFGDPTTNPKKLETVPLAEILEQVQYGSSKKLSESSTIPCLRMNNITEDGLIDTTKLKFHNSEENPSKFILKRGDLLFNRTNSRELVGKTAIFELDGNFTFAGYLIRLKCNLSKSDPYFVNAFMNMPDVKRKIRSVAKGAVGQANINSKEIQRLSIIKPDIDLQKKYGIIYKNCIEQIRHCMIFNHNCKELHNSLLHNAFLGKLIN